MKTLKYEVTANQPIAGTDDYPVIIVSIMEHIVPIINQAIRNNQSLTMTDRHDVKFVANRFKWDEENMGVLIVEAGVCHLDFYLNGEIVHTFSL